MKKIIIIFIAASLFTMSCSKQLDLDPTQSVNEDLVFTSNANILAALNGAYDVASGADLLGGDLQFFSELLGANEEIEFVGTFNQIGEFYDISLLTNNSYVRDTWAQAYRTVNICNNILANINIVDADERDRVKGEALFLRGLMFFELVKFYGKPYSAGNITTNLGVQIVTTPTVNGDITASYQIARSTIKETYDQVLSDLIASKGLMSEDVGVFGNTYAASAVLSRVYLQMEDFAKARDEANTVIENSGASLEDEFSKAFNNTAPSSEDIFVLPVTAQDGNNEMHTFWSTLDYGARDGDVEIQQGELDIYELGDARLALYFADGAVYCGKWQLQYKYLPLIRLAELYLTRAECNFRLSTAVGATPKADVDLIRNRAQVASIAITLNNILAERKREIVDEGQRIHDIKRLRQSVTSPTSIVYAYDANKLVLPIPIREINAAGKNAAGESILIQNPGY